MRPGEERKKNEGKRDDRIAWGCRIQRKNACEERIRYVGQNYLQPLFSFTDVPPAIT